MKKVKLITSRRFGFDGEEGIGGLEDDMRLVGEISSDSLGSTILRVAANLPPEIRNTTLHAFIHHQILRSHVTV